MNVSKSFEDIESACISVNKGNVNLVATNNGYNATKDSGGVSNDANSFILNGRNIVVEVSGPSFAHYCIKAANSSTSLPQLYSLIWMHHIQYLEGFFYMCYY